MTKRPHNQTFKIAILFIVALFVLLQPGSAGGYFVPASETGRLYNLGYVADNKASLSNVAGYQAIQDDTTSLVCPKDISTYTDLNSCDALVTSGLRIADPENEITSLTWQMQGATEDQSPASGVNQLSSYVFNEGTTIITYRGQTRFNNPVFCSFTVTVSDNQVPRLVYSPVDITVSNIPGECYARVSWTEPIVSDNCATRDNIIVEASHSPGENFLVGETLVEYTISDGVNELSYQFTITVIDRETPGLIAPEPKTIICGEEVEDAFTSWEQFEEAGGKASDNCAVDFESFRYVSQIASDIRCPYIITRTYSVADVNGNVSTVQRTIQVIGEEADEEELQRDETQAVLKSGAGIKAEECVIYDTDGLHSFTVPPGVSTISVEVWGAGGGGGGSQSNNIGGGGGGGGGYTINGTVSVTPGATYTNVITVGAGGSAGASNGEGGDGGTTTAIFGATTVSAGGGEGGHDGSTNPNKGEGGAGGIGGTYDGGAGGNGQDVDPGAGGGGGSSAGSTGDGNPGGLPTGGTAPADGGAGGDGGTSASVGGNPGGNPGYRPGGGGGGAAENGGLGGTGAPGQVRICYDCPTFSIASLSADPACAYSAVSTVTINMNQIAGNYPAGTYTVTYNRTNPAATGLTATMTVNASGTGTFNATGFTTAGTSTITITDLSSGSCSTPITTNNTIDIDVYPSTLLKPVITGTASQCPSSTGQVYSVADVTYAESYNWIVPSGWSIESGQGTNTITVTTGTAGQNGNISVTANNLCTSSAAAVFAVIVLPNASITSVIGPSDVCIGNNAGTFTANGVVLGGGTGVWSSSNTAVATVNSISGVVTAISAGTTNITYTITGGCGSPVSASAPLTVTPNAAVPSVTGNTPLCINETATYDAPGAILGNGTGKWSSSNTSVATVNPSTGEVTAVGAGTTNIIYTITGGCGGTKFNQQSLTVTPNAAVTSVTGASPICIGESTSYTANGVVLGGGTGSWSSSDELVATVDASGVVTAVSAGTANIIYTITGGCNGTPAAQKTITVTPNSAVASVTGPSPLCVGVNGSYSASGVVLGGGTGSWSSSNTAVATVNPTTGAVTTLSAGSTDIIFTVTGGCNAPASAQQTLEVTAAPTVDVGDPIDPICQGQPTPNLGGSVGGSASGGTWSSSAGGTFAPNASNLDATWTPPSNFTDIATLTLTTSGACSAVSASKTVEVIQQPVILVHPADQLDCYTRVVDFNVTATGSSLTYTWYRKRPADTDFTELPVGSPNVTFPTPGTIRLDNVGDDTYNLDGSQYKVVVSNGTCSAESNPATLTVNRITAVDNSTTPSDETSVTLCNGSDFSYQVTVNHPENVISYQWKRSVSSGVWTNVTNNGVISGANSSQLTFTNATPNESAEYKVTISFNATSPSGCTVTSETFDRTLTILPEIEAPVVTGPQTICYNTPPAPLTATAATGGSGTFDYQWESSTDNSNWSPIGGANSLTYSPLALTASTYYHLVATDNGTYDCGSIKSESVLISVDAAPTASISGSETTCTNREVTVNGASATHYSSILWTHNGSGNLTDETTLTPTYIPDISDAGNTVILTMEVSGNSSCGTATATATYTIDVEAVPTATIDYGNTDFCADEAPVTPTISGTSGGSFAASPAGLTINASTGQIDPTTSSPNTYTITYTIPATATCNPVDVTTTVTINELPDAETGPDGNICVGESVTLGGTPVSGHTYSWSDDPSGIPEISTDAQITVSPSTTTIYYLTETITTTGCTNTNSVTVTSNQVIDITIDPASPETCSDVITNISLNSNYIGTTFSWTAALESGTASGFVDGSGDVIAQTLVNNSGSDAVVKYSIAAQAGVCQNTDIELFVTVHPAPSVPVISASATTICDGETTSLTSSAASGYQWYKDGVAISGANNQTYDVSEAGDYTVEITDGNGCTALSIPTTIVVNPRPTATIAGTTDVCQDATEPLITFTGSGGTAPYTFTYTINGTPAPAITTTSGNSVTVSAPTDVTGPFNYELVSVEDASSTTCDNSANGTATITVNPLPTATISGGTEVCVGDASPLITLTGSNGTAPYTFTYNINGNPDQTITTTSGSSINIPVSTSTDGVFTYNLVSVQDASSTSCSNPAPGSETVTVNDLPTGSISGDATVCQDATAPLVTFTATGGSEPYTFTYNINGGSTETITTASGNTVTVAAPTDVAGNFTYNLLSVTDGTSTACPGSASGVAVIRVNPLPTATISGPTPVCQDDATPAILFEGAGGSLPYTFTYRIDGGTDRTVTTNGGSSAIVFAPTDSPGTFNYELISIQDGSSACINPITGQSADVTVNALPTATIAVDVTEVCIGGTQPVVSFTGSDGVQPYTFTYSINSGAYVTAVSAVGSDVATVTVPTDIADDFHYELISVTDASSTTCTNPIPFEDVTVTVSPYPEAIATVTIPPSCVGGDATVTITPTVGVMNYTYTFDGNVNPINNGVFTGIKAGTYSWSMEEGSSCGIYNGTITVEDPIPVEIDAPVVTDVACASSSDGQIVVTATGGTGTYTYSISPSVGGQSPDGTFTGLTAQTYTITATDGNGCTGSADVTVGIVPDVTAPVISGCPADITVSTGAGRLTCDQVANWTAPTATDDCTLDANLVWTSTHASGSTFPVGTTPVTIYVSDASGNESSCTFNVIVEDNTPPVPDFLGGIDASCSVNYPNPEPTATDNCDGVITGTTTTTFPVLTSTTVIWTFTDAAGNSSTISQDIDIDDDVSPTWDNPGIFTSTVPVPCDGDTSVAAVGSPSATDNCSSVNITHYDSTVFRGCASNYDIYRKWTVIDESGNINRGTQVINVRDYTDPIITCNDFSVSVPDQIDPPELLTGIDTFDNCGILSVTWDEQYVFDPNQKAGFCPEEVIRTYTVTDLCGNTATCTQTITVTYDDPTYTCEVCQDVVPYYSADLDDAPDSTWILEGKDVVKREGICCLSTDPNAAWGCISFNVYLDESAVGLYMDVKNPAPAGVEYYRVDCGEYVPLGEEICLTGGRQYTLTFCKPGEDRPDYIIQSIAGAVTTEDITTRADEECIKNIEVTGLEPGTITWSVVQPPGVDSLLDNLSCLDCANPVFTPEENIPPVIIYEVCGTLAGTYVCDGQPITDCAQVQVNTLPPVHVNIDVDLEAICFGQIPVLEAQVPEEDPSLTYTFTWYDGPDGTGNIVHTGRFYQPTDLGEYSVVVEEVSSGIGCNQDITNFNISYDLEGPLVLTPPAPLTIDCNDDAGDLDAQIRAWIATAQAYDEEDPSVTYEVQTDYTIFEAECNLVKTINFYAVDICGNRTDAYLDITVVDYTAPVIFPEASDMTVDCADIDPDQNLEFQAWLANHGGADATDGCSDPEDLIWTNDYDPLNWSGDYANNEVTVTFTVTDECGNSSETTATFTISDEDPPTIICPDPVSETAAPNNCSKTPVTPLDPTISDNCTPLADLILTYELSGATTTTGPVSGSAAGVDFNVGVTTVTYTVEDQAGYTATCSFTVTIVDVTPPFIEIDGCQDVTENAAPNNCSKDPDTIEDPVYHDDCWPDDQLILTYEITGATTGSGTGSVADLIFNVGVSTVTYTVTDPDNNSASCSFDVTIVDVTPPNITIDGCQDVTETTDPDECIKIPATIVDPVYSDDCWPLSALTLTWTMTGATTASGSGSVVGEPFEPGITTVTYTVTDPDNNTATCSFTVTIIPYDPPVFSAGCPPDPDPVPTDDNSCDAYVSIPVPDIDDPCNVGYTVVNDYNNTDDASDTYPVGSTTVTWTITPTVGPVVICVQTVVVIDLEAPTIDCPISTNPTEPDLFEEFVSGDGCEWAPTNVPDPTYDDNCEVVAVTYVLSGATTGSSPATGFNFVSAASLNLGITTVTYTSWDAYGNSSEPCSIRIWTKNIDDPHFNVICPTETSITVPAEDDLCSAEVTVPAPSIDNFCVEVYSATYQIDSEAPVSVTVPAPVSGISTLDDLVETFDVGTHTVRWTIVSASGTPYICDITVEVQDLQIPTIDCPISTNPTEPDLFEEFVSGDGCEWAPTNVPDPTYDDNCEVVAVTYVLSGATTGSSPATGFNFVSAASLNLGITTVTYTSWDAYGNSSEPCSIRIWTKNIDDPHFNVICPTVTSITVPAEDYLCDAEVTVPAPSIDNFCEEIFSITYQINSEDPVDVVAPAPVGGITTLDPLVERFEVGIHTVRWTIVSASGTPYICDITIEVTDLPPFVDCPDPYYYQADFAVPYKDDITVDDPTYGDNCPNPVLEWTLVEPDGTTYYGTGDPSGINILPNPRRYYVGVTTITYKITDSSGLTDECSFTVTVYGPPKITCPPTYITPTDPGVCTATRNSGDYGLPTLDEGIQPITWTWTITYPAVGGTVVANGSFVGSASDPGPPDISDYPFELGESLISWRAENISGFDECSHLVIVVDEEPPTFVTTPMTNCVDMLYSAIYTTGATDPFNRDNLVLNPSPDVYTFEAGNTALDLTDLQDNCCDSLSMVDNISWTINFADTPDPDGPVGTMMSNGSISSSGQPSEYGQILFPGDGVEFNTVTHTITYTLEDCHGNVSTPPVTEYIYITPRPEIIKQN